MRSIRVVVLVAGVVALCAGTIAGAQGSGSGSNDQYTNDGGAIGLVEEQALIANQELFGPDVSPGLYYPDGSKSAVHRIFADQDLETVRQYVAAAGRSGTVEASAYTAAELEKVQAALELIELPEGTAFGGAYDAELDLYVFEGNVPEANVAAELKGQRYRYTFTATDIDFRLSRTSDASPHSGGARINNTTAGWSCTVGFSVRSGSTQRILTAGHCGTVNNSFASPGGQSFGKMTQRAPYPKNDLAMLSASGQQYQGKIYIGGASGTLKPVKSAGGPGTGGHYCTSGSSGYQHCGFSVQSTNATACDASGGCTTGLVMADKGSVIKDGDSGGPFYTYTGTEANPTGILARGTIVGKINNLSYFENWQKAASVFNVTIATS